MLIDPQTCLALLCLDASRGIRQRCWSPWALPSAWLWSSPPRCSPLLAPHFLSQLHNPIPELPVSMVSGVIAKPGVPSAQAHLHLTLGCPNAPVPQRHLTTTGLTENPIFLQRAKGNIGSHNPTPGFFPEKFSLCSPKTLYMNGHGSIIIISPNWKQLKKAPYMVYGSVFRTFSKGQNYSDRERIRGGWGPGVGGVCGCKGAAQGDFWGDEMFCVLMVGTRIYACVKIHRTAPQKGMVFLCDNIENKM